MRISTYQKFVHRIARLQESKEERKIVDNPPNCSGHK